MKINPVHIFFQTVKDLKLDYSCQLQVYVVLEVTGKTMEEKSAGRSESRPHLWVRESLGAGQIFWEVVQKKVKEVKTLRYLTF